MVKPEIIVYSKDAEAVQKVFSNTVSKKSTTIADGEHFQLRFTEEIKRQDMFNVFKQIVDAFKDEVFFIGIMMMYRDTYFLYNREMNALIFSIYTDVRDKYAIDRDIRLPKQDGLIFYRDTKPAPNMIHFPHQFIIATKDTMLTDDERIWFTEVEEIKFTRALFKSYDFNKVLREWLTTFGYNIVG